MQPTTSPRRPGRPRRGTYLAVDGRSVLIRVRALRTALAYLRAGFDTRTEVRWFLMQAMPHRAAWWGENAAVMADVLRGFESALREEELRRRG